MRLSFRLGRGLFLLPLLSGCGADKCDTCIDSGEITETGVEDSGEESLDCEDEIVRGLEWFE